MKSRKEICLNLEVLEDRMTPSGAFSGAITNGLPFATPFEGFTGPLASTSPPQPGFRDSFAEQRFGNFAQLEIQQNQQLAFQNQLQSFQNSQIAAIDQYFTQVASFLKQFNIVFVV